MSNRDVVVYQRGKEVQPQKRPPLELMQLVLLDDMRRLLQRIDQAHEREHFEGEVDKRNLSATSQLQVLELVRDWPYTPWISVFIVNNGPDTVKIGINKAHDWIEIVENGTRTINHANADERIERIYYKCDAGNQADVDLEGEY